MQRVGDIVGAHRRATRLGWLMRKHGLSCDNLLSAAVVWASVELLTASATEIE